MVDLHGGPWSYVQVIEPAVTLASAKVASCKPSMHRLVLSVGVCELATRPCHESTARSCGRTHQVSLNPTASCNLRRNVA